MYFYNLTGFFWRYFLEKFLAKDPLFVSKLECSGSKDRKLLSIRRDTSNQYLFKNKK